MRKSYLIQHLHKILPVGWQDFFSCLSVSVFFLLFSAQSSGQTVVPFSSSGTWTVPAGVTSATIYLWGGGGGGGGARNGNADGAGGGGGACGYATVSGLTAGNLYTITIGAGGTAGSSANGGGPGGTGGTTTFTGAAGTWTVTGGLGGAQSTGGGVPGGGVGGSTGTGTGITINAGGHGSNGNDASNFTGTGGGGGGSGAAGTTPASACGVTGTGGTGTYPGGNGGYNPDCGTNVNQAGAAGSQPGGGGSGARDHNTNEIGGIGGAGQVIVVYTITPTITSFTPGAGCTNSLPLVTITGTNLTGTTAVNFNGLAAASFANVNANTVTATPAAGTTTGVITLTTAGGTATSAGSFTVNTAGAITPFININGTGWGSNPIDTLCQGGSVEFGPQPLTGTWSYTGPSGFHSYQRDTLISNIQMAQAGTYTATYINASNGCSNTQNYVITVNALPTPSVNNATSCSGAPVTLTATGGVSYLWSTGAATASITTATAGTYTVTATNASGCTATASGTVTAAANPTPTVNSPTTCAGTAVTLTAAGGASYLWSTGAATNPISVTPLGTTVYTVTATNAAGCTASVNSTVTVNAVPSAASTNGAICSLTPATLTASGGTSYHWSTGAVTASITASLPGTYTVTVTNAATCTATASGTVVLSTTPSLSVNNATVCNGTAATLTASVLLGGPCTYLWSTGASTASISVTPAGTTTYSVTATNAAGCSATASGTVTVNAVPVATITPSGPTTFCAGGNVTLTASGGGTYSWSTGALTAAITASASNTYTVTVTNAAFCTATASQAVTVNALPTPSVNNATSCSGAIVTLTATGGASYHWSTGAVTASINTSVAGTYTVTATNAAGCTATASGTVTAAANPTPTVNNASICPGGTATLTATGGASYLWSTGAATTSISPSPASTTTYSVTATNVATCTATASGTVTVNPAASASISAGGPTTFCAGGSVTLTASGGGTYSWSTGASTAAITPSPVSTTTYTVTVTNGFTCTATASKVVTVNALPTPSVNNATSCSGATVTLTATGGVSYIWSTGAVTTSITTAAVGTYTVTATNAAGCTATASGTVTSSNPTPTVNNPATCAGGIDTLHATGGGAGATYIWSTGATTDTITTTVAGVYSVTVTNASGCSATASGIATVNAIPTPTVNSPTICPASIATLTATGGAVYVWSTGATTTSISTATAGTYTVTATSPGSCTATASGTVTIVSNPVVTVNNAVICSGVAVTLTASGASAYVWSTGALTPSITATTAGTYAVTGTSSSGCTASVTATVTASVNPTPTVNSPAICAGNSATLTATGGASYVWSTGATTTSITVSPASTTTYTVTATNAGGCTASASGTVTVNALPTPTVTSGVVCTGGATIPATLTATISSSYHWNTGSVTDTIMTLTAGTYTVTVTNAAGCTATASGTVTTAAKPVPTVNSASVCHGSSVTLTATPAGDTYLWTTGATTVSISVTPAATTTYTVTVTNAAGCSAAANGTATVYSLPVVTTSSNSPVLLNGTINLTSTVTGGTPTFAYSWSGPSAFSSAVAGPSVALAQPVNAGAYTVTVTDFHGCTATSTTTVILNFTSPGGIPSNDALWLNANVGVTTAGINVSAWADQSGLGNNATTVNGTAPTRVVNSINSYPVVNFSAGGLQGAFGTAITSSAVSAFVVAQASAASAIPSGIFSIIATAGSDQTGTNSAALFERSTNEIATLRNNAIQGNYTNANAIGQYHLETSIFSSASNQNLFYSEGAAATNTVYASTAFNTTKYTIGSRDAGAPASYLTGQIAEVVLFNTQLTAAQKNQVESYLATKYGFTLNQTTATNYVASNGATFWNAATNGTFKNNIFGVGIDNISTLNQTQSVSLNTNLLSLNTATNLSFYSFLMVSDNAAGNTLTSQSNLPNNINAALSTVWRASQTGNRGTANYVFNTTATAFGYYAPISSLMTPYMLIDSNADGIYETYITATTVAGSVITFNTSLNDGAQFTLGFKASIDFGDAPGVPTLMANSGAGHMIVPGVYLGALIDAELDGQPSVNSLGDDTIGLADEDGVNFNIGVPTTNNIVQIGSTNTIQVTASTAGYLNAWADLNQDNVYGGGGEYLIQNVHLAAGVNTVTFFVSDSVLYGPTSMRFRFAQHLGDVTAPTGLATNGEVEDYKIYCTAPLVGACTNGFQNPSFEQGPGPGTYIITNESNLPYWRTTATDQDVEIWHSGFNGGGVNVPAYDGTYFVELEANLFGALYQDVYTTPGTKLSWSFAHRGRFGNDTCLLKIGTPENPISQGEFIDGEFAWGLHTGFYTVPAGQYITRLAFDAVGSFGGNQSEGNFLDDVSVSSSFDYGDAPNSYGTLYANNGPYHNIINTLYLGYGVTCDADGQPSAAANLDSLDDGVTFPTACSNCNTYTVTINAFNNTGSPATIAGWIDFNKNGVFDTTERASITIPSSAVEQAVTMTFTVTVFSSVSASTYARFRIANDSTQIATPYGLATTGEVEDYKVPCIAVPIPVPSASSPACARGPLDLTAAGTAPFFNWTGPNGYTSNVQNPVISSVPLADSGTYRVYAVYANGCERDSAVHVTIQACFVDLTGNIFDDANGNGYIDGTDATTSNGQTIYAVVTDTNNFVLATSAITAAGGFSFANIPAYTNGMSITVNTTDPTVGAASAGTAWPARWVGTKGQYGKDNQDDTGVYNSPNRVPIASNNTNISAVYIGYDRVPSTTIRNYLIGYPHPNQVLPLLASSGLGTLAGTDAEDGAIGSGKVFAITSLAGMNGNSLYYDANGDGILQNYEQITAYTIITNFDPTKLYMKFTGAGSTSATFTYGSIDAAGKTDPTPATYTINWVGSLPVKLLYFNAEKQGTSQSLLTWSTASEQDNAYFDVERSADAQSWESLGQVQGAGTTASQTNYSLVDSKPTVGINYYRLKQVDVDGNFTYSDIADVQFGNILDNSVTLMVYPNPVSQSSTVNIKLDGATDNLSNIIITNSAGQVVYNSVPPQEPSYQISNMKLPAGIYLVTVHTQATSVFTTRLVIE